MDLCIKYLRWILYSIRKSSSRLSETLMLEIAGAMIATYTISCWCTRKTAQNKQLTGYVLWKICECERTRDSRLLLSDVSPQDCDQGQVSWWPGGQDQDPLQWETFSYFRRLPGDYSRYITFTSPLPLRCWIRNLRSSELRLALGASSQHWTNTHLDIQILPLQFQMLLSTGVSQMFKDPLEQFSYVHLSHMKIIYSSPCRLLLVKPWT